MNKVIGILRRYQIRVFFKVFRGVLISPWLDQEGNKIMFLSEWREFPSVPCLAGGA